MSKYAITVLPGDGIGREVTAQALKVLKAACDVFAFELTMREVDWGYKLYKATNKAVPDDFLEQLKEGQAIFLGALGVPGIVPEHVSTAPIITIRQAFDQYVSLRPAKLYPNVSTPLANKKPGDIDILFVRENTEGEYLKVGTTFREGLPAEVALQTAIHSRFGVSRILRYAFELAAGRPRRRLTMATKSNALGYGMGLWDRLLEEIKPEYPNVQVDKWHVDAMCMHLVIRPEIFDVVVASNLFGDILSDLGGAISGSLGLAPSSNINPDGKYPSMFEPVHGSAPDIAGQDKANPLAAILAAAMMLDFLGQKEAAAAIDRAVEESLAQAQVRTPDLGGTATCTQAGRDIVERIMKLK
jgi:tartrate dehydrogenase/decarboxylase/D-malate dehydrogenase